MGGTEMEEDRDEDRGQMGQGWRENGQAGTVEGTGVEGKWDGGGG